MSGYLDDNGLRYLWTKIKNYVSNTLSTKVDKVTGKDLSSNDFTNTYKEKLDGIDAGANNYTLPTASSSVLGGVKVGSGLSIDNNGVLSSGLKFLKVDVDLSKSVDLGNGSYQYVVDFGFKAACGFMPTKFIDNNTAQYDNTWQIFKPGLYSIVMIDGVYVAFNLITEDGTKCQIITIGNETGGADAPVDFEGYFYVFG